MKKNEITNHFAKKIEISSDKTEWTIHPRKGVKWSDGHSFTADDIMFWYNDVLLNEDLTPVVGTDYKAGGEVMDLNQTHQDPEIREIFENVKFSC